MFLELSKALVVALLAATFCSASSIVHQDKNDSDVDHKAGNATSPAACGGAVTPQKCWDNQIEAHVTGGAGTCDGGHVTTAIEDAVTHGDIWNVQVLNWNANAGLLLMQWEYGDPHNPIRCLKTVWNDVPNFVTPSGDTVESFEHENIESMCVNAIATTNCVSTPWARGIVVDNRYGGLICLSVGIGHPPVPGRSCYPEGISTPPLTANTGDPCP